MADYGEIYRETDLGTLRRGLVDAIKEGDNEKANAYAWQAGAVARANREGRPIGSGVDLDFDAEHRRARRTIERERNRH